MKFTLRFGLFLLLIFTIRVFMRVDVMAQKVQPLDLRENLKLIETIDFTKDELYQALFTDKNELFITTKNRVTSEWNYRIDNVRRSFSPCGNKAYSFGVPNSNENLFAISCPDFSVEIWNLKEAKRLIQFQVPKDKNSESLFPYLSPNGKRIIFKPSSLSEEAELWDAVNGTKFAVFSSLSTDCETCNRTVYETVFSPDSKKVAVSHGGIVLLWKPEAGELLSRLMDEKVRLRSSEALSHNGVVSQILFSSDSQTIITGSYDGIVKSWKVETGELLHTFKGHKDRITSLALSPDGKILATGSKDQKFKLWDIETGKLLLTSVDNKKTVHILSFSPDGKKILSMTDNRVFIWESKTGKLLEQMSSSGELSTMFSPNWKFVITRDKGKKMLRLYEYMGG